MALESPVNHIADLVVTNPAAGDAKSQGDDHIRNIKKALANDLCGFAGAIIVTGADGGAVNTYTITPSPTALVAYGTRMIAVFSPTITNTGTATLNISGLGAKSIFSVSGAPLAAGELAAGCVYLAVYDGTQFRMAGVTKGYVDGLAFAGSPGLSNFLHVRDQKASGVSAGNSVIGDQVRTLNTVVTNTISGASLAGNQVTLPGGTYQVMGRAPCYGGGGIQLSLRNVTDAAYTLLGATTQQIAANSVDTTVQGQFVIASPKVFSLNHYTTAAQTDGLGTYSGIAGRSEVYGEVLLWKIA